MKYMPFVLAATVAARRGLFSLDNSRGFRENSGS